MAEKRRGPGRPAYDSKQKLVSAASALLAERGYEATSPKMILDRAGVGQGSMYHHYRSNEDLALDAFSHMRDRSIAFLEGHTQQNVPAEVPSATGVVTARPRRPPRSHRSARWRDSSSAARGAP